MSGGRREVFNLRERAVSTDHNRHQRFAAFERAELLGFLLGPKPAEVELGSYSVTNGASVGTPLEGHVLDGLMVIAEVGGDELGVQPGEVLLWDPDGVVGSSDPNPPNADDSGWKLVRDDGFAIGSGTLTLTANVSGATRWDVIECRRSPGVVVETDTRDVFSESAGVFLPAIVNKYTRDELEYRIRSSAATVTTAQGWLPLMVAVVPNLAATWDTCTLYDVRPLARERRPLPFSATGTMLPSRRAHLWVDLVTGVSATLRGVIEAESGGFFAGGEVRFRDSTAGAGAEVENIDLTDTAFHEPGLVVAANSLLYLWLVFPYGLPRWRIYSVGVVAPYGGRVPRGLCGIPVISSTPPSGYDGQSFAGARLPSISGFPGGDVATQGVLLTPVLTNSTPDFLMFEDDGDWWVGGYEGAAGGGGTPLALTPATVAGAVEDFFDLVAGTHYPRNAKALLCRFTATFTGAGGTVFEYRSESALSVPGSILDFQALGKSQSHQLTMPGGGSIAVAHTVEVPLIPQIPSTAITQRVAMLWNQNGGIALAAGSQVEVMGWRT